jgi:hypothetical protein
MSKLGLMGLVCLFAGAFGCSAADPSVPEVVGERKERLHDTTSVFAYVDMMNYQLNFYEPELDMEVSVDLLTLPCYGSGVPLHAYITDNGHKVYVGFNGDASSPTGMAVIRVNDIFWHDHTADVEVIKTLIVDDPAQPSTFPPVTGTNPLYPFQPWTAQPFTQLHGPAEVRSKERLFWTILTDNRVVTVDTATDTLLPVRSFGEASRFLHGISFNPAEKKGLGAGYFYDRGYLPTYKVKDNGELQHTGKIWLGTAKAHAAYVHNVEWLTNRYALVGTMQLAKTSLTPSGAQILGPSVWLVDTREETAKRVIGPTNDVNGAGIFRSASWVTAVGCTLFVGEEDSLDDSFGDDGYVSVFDISDRRHPRFIKRLRPGVELPADFVVGHALVATPDGKSVIMESYPSGYILRIGVESLEVEHIIHGHAGQHAMPHGGSIVSTLTDHGEEHEHAAAPAFTDGLPE